MYFPKSSWVLAAWVALVHGTGALAQTAPDTGRILQELQEPALKPQNDRDFELLTPQSKGLLPEGGTAVEIRSVHLSGNSLFDTATLLSQLGQFSQSKLDLAGMHALAEKIAAYYRAHGYPFTRVFIPPQDLSQGELKIQISEGRYGRVMPGGDPKLDRGAKRFLRALRPGDPIRAPALERAMLLLDNQPGMRVSPTMAPGSQTREGDLTAHIERVARFGVELGTDDAGDRYTGRYRQKINAYAYSPFMFGDLITLRGVHTNEDLWVGSIDYEVPLNGSGLRMYAGYARTTYRLGGEFEVLGASGFANVASFGSSYPLLRSRKRTVVVALGYQRESLQDRYTIVDVRNDKRCDCFPLSLQFDNRDGLLGGGLTYGTLVLTSGNLHLDDELAAGDAATARTAGRFERLNLNVSRIQAVSRRVNLMMRYAAQFASKNLDSSEQFNLGGMYGVRAYPVGEGMASQGWLLQTELRYSFNSFSPYLLYDTAHGRTNIHPWSSSSDMTRSISGAGFGARYNRKPWTIDAVVSWRTAGGRSIADNRDVNPAIWMSMSYRF